MRTTSSDHDGDINAIELKNSRGDSAIVLTLGATLAKLVINTRKYGRINTILGYPDYEDYRRDTDYHGVIAGRYCNRIAGSTFAINGERFYLHSNEGDNQLHGGPEGFHRQHWCVEEQEKNRVALHLISPDGDQGYPGRLSVRLVYCLGDDGALDISWEAESDRDTFVNLTSHAYFNLAGKGDVRDHWLRIFASHYTPADEQQIPTGEVRAVADSYFDLRDFRSVQDLLDSPEEDIRRNGGLDHNWARGVCGELLPAAELLCPGSGLLLQVGSTLPGLQCYTGNQLGPDKPHGRHTGVCLEPQFYPNSPNEPGFPTPLLSAGTIMHQQIRYQLHEVDAHDYLAEGTTLAAYQN